MGLWIGLVNLMGAPRFFRRLILIWAMIMGTVVILRATDDMSLVTAAVVSLVSTVLGLLSIPIGFYFKHRRDEERGAGPPGAD